MNVIKVANNLVPCEGPRAIPVKFVFESAGELELDLTREVQGGLISEIQGAYVDNLDGATVTIICALTNQRITIPGGWQGFVQFLVNTDARFSVQMDNPGTFNMHVLNIPTVHSILPANINSNAPLNSNSTGTVGQWAMSPNFFYWCYAPDSWARVAADTTPW